MSDTSHLAGHFREQAVFCTQLGSPFTAALCEHMVGDLEAGGPVAELISDWRGDPRKDALALRLCGALHHAVLTGAAPDLAEVYPKSLNDWDMELVWPRAQPFLAGAEDRVRAFIQSPPQTNETRRSIALLPGFLKISAAFGKPLNLLELGASAGLNQNWDRFNYSTSGWSRPGSSNVSVDTNWQGPPPLHLDTDIEIASRAACDQNPLNIHDPAAAIKLRSYAWPDQPDRLRRFDAAVALAREMDTQVDRADAAEWVRKKLMDRLEGVTTVVYHSVFLQYPPAEIIRAITTAIKTAGSNATEAAPLAWLCFEPEGLFGGDNTLPRMATRLQVWPSGESSILSHSNGHATLVEAIDGG
ncbi:MAG: DUF2332 family protein [Pseudomonadota bacterium]